MTHTYAVLEVSHETWNEISQKLRAAGYDHSFHESRTDGLVIDMHGIALKSSERERHQLPKEGDK